MGTSSQHVATSSMKISSRERLRKKGWRKRKRKLSMSRNQKKKKKLKQKRKAQKLRKKKLTKKTSSQDFATSSMKRLDQWRKNRRWMLASLEVVVVVVDEDIMANRSSCEKACITYIRPSCKMKTSTKLHIASCCSQQYFS